MRRNITDQQKRLNYWKRKIQSLLEHEDVIYFNLEDLTRIMREEIINNEYQSAEQEVGSVILTWLRLTGSKSLTLTYYGPVEYNTNWRADAGEDISKWGGELIINPAELYAKYDESRRVK
jgi:hypothetical protein